MKVQAAFLLSILFGVAHGYVFPAWYKCDPAICTVPNCRCASTSPPVPLEEAPQFILISNDDGVNQSVADLMDKMIGEYKQVNNCPIPVTWFTLVQGSECYVVQNRYQRGDELATHTSTHIQLNQTTPDATFVKEIGAGKEFLVRGCLLPEQDVVGFRSTYLVTNPATREFLYKNKFLYDSSNTFEWGSDVPPGSARSYPFTMDYGVADATCTPTEDFQMCFENETYPGMWEVPVWELIYDGQSYGMDPGENSAGNGQIRPVDAVLTTAFDAAYNGNRAPVPIFVHEGWFNGTRIPEAKKFIEYAMSKPDVYFVTMRQLIDYMQAPVPKSMVAEWLANRCAGGKLGPQPPPAPLPPTMPLSFLANSTTKTKGAIIGRRLRSGN